jgi:pyrroline-5-carboxylate reductase
LAETLARLTTPGGITEAGFKRMETVAGLAAWPAACDAALALMED